MGIWRDIYIFLFSFKKIDIMMGCKNQVGRLSELLKNNFYRVQLIIYLPKAKCANKTPTRKIEINVLGI